MNALTPIRGRGVDVDRWIDPDEWCDPMSYEELKYTFNQIDKAGDYIRNNDVANVSDAFDIVFNWRNAHRYPLHILYVTMKQRAKKVDPRALAAQRMKRFESILRKIYRNNTMQLSQMQDVGGCRAIVHGQKQLVELVKIYRSSPLRHDFQGIKDYISSPKADGYRSVHVMYRFVGNASTCAWNKLRVEIQLRTKLQHSWATAVETVDTFTDEGLKFGGGSSDWKRFFQLMGSVHAHLEGTSFVPNTPSDIEQLRSAVRELEKKLNVINLLNSWAHLTKEIQGTKGGKDYWYLIEIRPVKREIYIQTFSANKTDDANMKYKDVELKNKGTTNNAALVSVNSLSNLQKTYPNYFADTEMFTSSLGHFLGRGQ